ncbi:AraC family transcriptional regulator [Cohnella sp. GCM10027633]|uniref:AraC family transcriptional regulator n=1 Tax=unclassified Cohnella TaxID=2636738 RepID=UPI00363A2F3A
MFPDHYMMEVGFNAYRKPSELSVIDCGHGRPVGRHKIGPTIHDYYLMHTVKSGHGTFTCRGTEYECSAGDTFMIYAGELISYEADASDPWEYVWTGFVGRAAGELLRSAGVTPDRPVASGATDDLYGYYERTRRTLLDAELPSLVDMECAAYLRLMIYELGKSNRERLSEEGAERSDAEKRVRYAASFLKKQYAQPIAIESLASSLGYHRVYFSNLFRRYIGKSPKQYLYDARMEQAELLLTSTSLSVEQIAGSVGYGDPLYFSKHYQRWSGVAPTAYRKQKRHD